MILIIEIVISIIVSFWANDWQENRDLLFNFGLINLIIGAIGAMMGAIMEITKFRDKEISKNLMVASGILVLIGVGTCSKYSL